MRTQPVQRPWGRNELAVVRVQPGTSGSEPGFYSKWGVWEAVDSRTLPTGLAPRSFGTGFSDSSLALHTLQPRPTPHRVYPAGASAHPLPH